MNEKDTNERRCVECGAPALPTEVGVRLCCACACIALYLSLAEAARAGQEMGGKTFRAVADEIGKGTSSTGE